MSGANMIRDNIDFGLYMEQVVQLLKQCKMENKLPY